MAFLYLLDDGARLFARRGSTFFGGAEGTAWGEQMGWKQGGGGNDGFVGMKSGVDQGTTQSGPQGRTGRSTGVEP